MTPPSSSPNPQVRREDRQRLADIIETSSDAIFSKRPDGTITSWNHGAERLYGYSAEEAIGQSVTMLLPEGMDEEEPEVANALQRGLRLDQFETVRRRKCGSLVDVSITLAPLRNQAGKVTESASIQRDITHRRQAQAELRQAMISAEQASKAKSEFMANISHELRTPMNAIMGMTDLALNEPLSESVRDYLTTVKDSADAMLILINDILDFSRLEADGFELDPAPFDVRRMLEETMRSLSLRAHEKGLELAAQVHPDVPLRVVADAVRVRQMLTNLVGNAVKFTETGEVVVTVEPVDYDAADSSDWDAGESVTLHFCVSDTGIGISEKDQQRIFAPFTQVDASMTRSYAGTGLGLSICHELAQLQGGRIWLESEPGVGSRFHFTVTVEVAAATDAQTSADSMPIDALEGTRVLIVDDNETSRRILAEMLESWSMIPCTADGTESAIQQLQAAAEEGEGFPLLLVDAVMPNADGIELLQQLEQSTESVGASILMLSPADKHLFRRRSDGLRVGAFVEKPVSQSSLLNGIREAIGDVAVVRSPDQAIVAAPRSLNVLVAEDIPANQKVVSAILKKRGHDVTIAHNGREAIDLRKRVDFDVVLMDVQMPVLDGLQATKTIRELERGTGKQIPIIAMTAHAMRGDREACLAAGMNAYVPKPLDADLLLRTLEKLAAGQQSSKSQQLSLVTKSGTWRYRSRTVEPPASPEPPSPPQDQKPVWNVDVALKRMGDDAVILGSMVDYFFEDSPGLMQQLEECLQSDNPTEATRLAHSLKGLCANFEATAAVKVAQEIETMCRDNELADANERLPLLRSELEALTAALEVWKSEQGT
ncbi:response regulator [Fuerstiella marisgermanici]|uniref:Sensory/regulatory protein RpfC n=1 Tax=Fuerstiella marisgermanici TaxID=1891926 RepID=A0A1P8WHS8_9PLAN|nr:response regulator [Fuerstiella marisgermanici]APZ93622.1 Signal transduction histidine-protein kinase BarA [Fuerstiella marisgermanici]